MQLCKWKNLILILALDANKGGVIFQKHGLNTFLEFLLDVAWLSLFASVTSVFVQVLKFSKFTGSFNRHLETPGGKLMIQ